MQASNKGTPAEAACTQALLAARDGAAGVTVRCTPRRITRMVEVDGVLAFAKLRTGRPGDAEAEWRWLHELPQLGLPAPVPLAFVRIGRWTGLLTRALAGRTFDAWAQDAQAEGAHAMQRLCAFAAREVAPKVAALHRAGLVYRDLYWNHVVADAVDGSVAFLDVERVFRPRWRFERWRMKDLAGLASSYPGDVPLRFAVRFLRAYLAAGACAPQGRGMLRRWMSRASEKARRIRSHAPKFG